MAQTHFKNKIIPIISITFFSIMSIGLFFTSSFKHANISNNFKRFFPANTITSPNTLDLKFNSFYIAGTTSNYIYLGNYTAPLSLFISNLSITEKRQAWISNIENIKLQTTKLMVDSPSFYIAENVSNYLLSGDLTDMKIKKININGTLFAEVLAISRNSFVIKTLNRSRDNLVLAKEVLDNSSTQFASNLLEKQIDGIFSTDGMLLYNRELGLVIYIYYYRNQFICVDTSLNLIYKGKTIDTNSQAKIKIIKIKSLNSITLATPPLLVNKKSCVSGKWLFINSNLISDNEIRKEFSQSSVIDVYNLHTGKYKFSFYISDLLGKKIKNFQVTGNTLIALYDHYMVTYKLNPKYLTD